MTAVPHHLVPERTSSIRDNEVPPFHIDDQFMPTHLKRIYSAVDELAPDVDFGVSEQLDSQVSDDPQHLSQRSEADSLSTIEQNDSQASLAMSQEATPNTSFSEQKFKKPKRSPKV